MVSITCSLLTTTTSSGSIASSRQLTEATQTQEQPSSAFLTHTRTLLCGTTHTVDAEKFFFTLQAFYAKFVNQSVDELSSESARRWMNYFRVSKSMLILVNITIHNKWGTFVPTTTTLCTKAWTTNMEKLHFAFEFTLGDAHLTRGDLRWLRRPREDKDTRHLLFRCQLTVDKGFPLHLDWPMMELISFFPCMNMIYNELWRFPTSVAFCAYKVCHSRPQTPDN